MTLCGKCKQKIISCKSQLTVPLASVVVLCNIIIMYLPIEMIAIQVFETIT